MLELSRHGVVFSTQRFNSSPARLWSYLGVLDGEEHPEADDKLSSHRKRKRRRRAVERFYDIGTLFAILSTAIALGLVILAGFQLITRLLALEGDLEKVLSTQPPRTDSIPLPDPLTDPLQNIQGRDLPAAGLGSSSSPASIPVEQARTDTPLLTPLLPGVTIPFWHVLPLTTALLLCQIVHEAGHALVAALSGITPLSTGFAILIPGMPSAFVALPSSALALFSSDIAHGLEEEPESGPGKILSLQEQLRVIAAGVWHNAISGAFLAVVRLFGIGSASLASETASLSACIALTLEYAYTLSVALSVFNMLPLWGLDGEEFAERLALVLLRRRKYASGNESAGTTRGPWNDYVGDIALQNVSNGAARLDKRQHRVESSIAATSKRLQSSGSNGVPSLVWPLSSLSPGSQNERDDLNPLRGRMRGMSRADELQHDVEQGSRFAMLQSGSTAVPSMIGESGARRTDSAPVANPEEERLLRALRTRVRGVLGLAVLAVFGGTILLELVTTE
ncbi:hypothetical protein OC846_004822 [Tilletia horrida]|uniref:Endopeptidase S2P n=1 Tax=Tilletia horrida TaxID=155126 RepID=A0AAN6GLW9_9BASI|nr:hypothetical protein OC845_004950 [Tilletia horrida]KAK0547516.1 hypothetical protein OC846_004822 [Tilletia horrida]KAK0562992.1 hypothetical protein OC861_005037 [Tilletia horrida]